MTTDAPDPTHAPAIRSINGRKYDISRCKLIASYADDPAKIPVDFCAAERLYLSPQKIWILRGEGGPFTQWQKPGPAGTIHAGAGILRLSRDQARDWLVHRGLFLIADEYGLVR